MATPFPEQASREPGTTTTVKDALDFLRRRLGEPVRLNRQRDRDLAVTENLDGIVALA